MTAVRPYTYTESTLVAVFDLEAVESPYEVLPFLNEAEAARYGAGKETIFVHVLPDRNVEQESPAAISMRDRLIGCFALLDTIGGYSLSSSRPESERILAALIATPAKRETFVQPHAASPPCMTGVADASEGRGPSVSALHGSQSAFDYVDRWIAHAGDGRRIATLTVDGVEGAGSAAWMPAVREALDSSRYFLVDTSIEDRSGSVAGGAREAFPTCPGVKDNADLRIALYARADINVFHGAHTANLWRSAPDISALSFSGQPQTFESDLRIQLAPTADPDEIVRAIRRIEAGITGKTQGRGMNAEHQFQATVEEAYELAVRLFQFSADDNGKAISIFKDILLREPNNGDAAAMLAMAAHKFSKHEEAIGLFQHALSCKDTDPAYYFNLALSHVALENDQEALIFLKQAALLDDTLYEAFDVMGKVFKRQGKTQAALDAYELAHALRGITTSADLEKAQCLFELGRIDDAVEAIRSFIDRWLYSEANGSASAVMIWPWCARFYDKREARFPEFRWSDEFSGPNS